MNRSNWGSLGNELLLGHGRHRCGVRVSSGEPGAGAGHPRASGVDAAGNEGRAPVETKGPGRPATQSCDDPRVSAKCTFPGSALTRPGEGCPRSAARSALVQCQGRAWGEARVPPLPAAWDRDRGARSPGWRCRAGWACPSRAAGVFAGGGAGRRTTRS